MCLGNEFWVVHDPLTIQNCFECAAMFGAVVPKRTQESKPNKGDKVYFLNVEKEMVIKLEWEDILTKRLD